MDRQTLVAQRIKQAREQAGLSQAELGKIFGCSDVNISRIERGITGIDLSSLERLAGKLGKPLDWFLSDHVEAPHRPLEVIASEIQQIADSMAVVQLPVYGRAPAGYPDNREQQPEGQVEVIRADLKGANPKNLYALKVSGNSLSGDNIYAGQYVIVEPDGDIEDGKIYVVMIDGEIVIRHVYRIDDKVKLAASNKDYKLLELSQVEVRGRVILSGGAWNKH